MQLIIGVNASKNTDVAITHFGDSVPINGFNTIGAIGIWSMGRIAQNLNRGPQHLTSKDCGSLCMVATPSLGIHTPIGLRRKHEYITHARGLQDLAPVSQKKQMETVILRKFASETFLAES